MKRILIADPDHTITFTLERLLTAESYEVLACNTADALLHLSESRTFELVIVNPLLHGENGDDILAVLQARQTGAAFFLLVEEHAIGEPLLSRVFDQFRKPLDYHAVINRIRELFTGGGFSGIISGIGLADYIRIFCLNRITKAILVKNGDRRGIVLIEDGRVIYADTERHKGEEAFTEILAWPQGQIKEVKVKKFPPPNIATDIKQLLPGPTVARDEQEAESSARFPAHEPAAAASDSAAPPQAPGSPSDGPPRVVPASTQTGRGRRTFVRGAVAVFLLLTGLFLIGRQNVAFDMIGGKSPVALASDAAKPAAADHPDKQPDQSGIHRSGTTSRKEETGKPGIPAAGRPAGSPPASSAATPPATAPLFRLHGSNTIGAKLAPALVAAYLQTKLQATDIVVSAGEKEDEQTIAATIQGKRIAVEIQAHGSTTAFEDLAAGTCDIGNASRKIKDTEVDKLAALGDMTGIASEHIIGLDGIAVLINPTNDTGSLSTGSLQAIFSGTIASWREINSRELGITVYARDDKSGTYDTFKSLVLGEKHRLAPGAKRYESNADLSDDVSRDPSGIGFAGLPYVRNSKVVAVSEEGAQAIYPNFFTIAGEDYPLSRRLYMYTAALPKNPHVAPFIRFVLSEEGQKIVQETGFVDMNIRSLPQEGTDTGKLIAPAKVQDYLHAIRNAQRLSLNFRFKKNLAALDNRSVRDLDRIISFLADKLEKKILLAGFADASGDYEYNRKLAMARAQLVASELRARGIAVSEVFSCGQEMPVASNLTDQGREKNRRVEVWLQ